MNDLVGRVFGRLTVIEHAGTEKNGTSRWLCACECGEQTIVRRDSLLSGKTRSCGCLQRDLLTTHGHASRGETPTYMVWRSMLQRCENPNHRAYINYGGRGIKVCDHWREFGNFLADMGEQPKGLSLDRIDNNGNYELDNCHWATTAEQARNRRDNHMIEYGGKTQCLADWAKELNLDYGTLSARLGRFGWPIEKALTTPVGKKHGDAYDMFSDGEEKESE